MRNLKRYGVRDTMGTPQSPWHKQRHTKDLETFPHRRAIRLLACGSLAAAYVGCRRLRRATRRQCMRSACNACGERPACNECAAGCSERPECNACDPMRRATRMQCMRRRLRRATRMQCIRSLACISRHQDLPVSGHSLAASVSAKEAEGKENRDCTPKSCKIDI
jgi:hypothetical protein